MWKFDIPKPCHHLHLQNHKTSQHHNTITWAFRKRKNGIIWEFFPNFQIPKTIVTLNMALNIPVNHPKCSI